MFPFFRAAYEATEYPARSSASVIVSRETLSPCLTVTFFVATSTSTSETPRTFPNALLIELAHPPQTISGALMVVVFVSFPSFVITFSSLVRLLLAGPLPQHPHDDLVAFLMDSAVSLVAESPVKPTSA
jgi:hypothetical protein